MRSLAAAPYAVLLGTCCCSVRATTARLLSCITAHGRRYGCDILSGLAELHRRGIVMLDLKPQNVLLDDSGRAVLADFGLARVLKEGATHASVSCVKWSSWSSSSWGPTVCTVCPL